MALNLADLTSNNNDLTNSGAAESSSVPFLGTNNSHSLDLESTSTQYASIADASQTGLDITGDFTIEFWFKPETIGAYGMLVTKDTYPAVGGADRGYGVYVDNLNKIHIYYNQSQILVTDILTTNAAITSSGIWFHIASAVDVSAKTAVIFINGVSFGTTTLTGDAVSIQNCTSAFCIGKREGTSALYADGLIDDVRVWSDIRTAQEISDNMAKELVGDEANLVGYWKFNNSALDETANNNDLTLSGSPSYVTDVGFYGANAVSADLESTESDYLTITDASQTGLDITNNITMEAWFKLESLPADPATFVIMSKYTGAGNQRSYSFTVDTATGVQRLRSQFMYDGTYAAGNDVAVSVGVLTTGVWYHGAVTYASNQVNFYLNGAKVGTTQTTTNATIYSGSSDFLIGSYGGGGSYLDGIIDEVRVWNDVRTAEEIGNNFTRPLVGNEANLVAYWSFDATESSSASLSPSLSPSPSASDSLSPSLSPSRSPSLSPSPSASVSLSPSVSESRSSSLSPSPSSSISLSPSSSISLSPSTSESRSASRSPSASTSLSPSLSPSRSPSLSPSPSSSASLSPSASLSRSPSVSESRSPSVSPSSSSSLSPSPSSSPSLSPSVSPSASESSSPSPSLGSSESRSPSASESPSPSASPSPSSSESLSPSLSESPSPSLSPSPSSSASLSPSLSESLSPSASESPSPSASPSPSSSVSLSPSPSPSSSESPSPSVSESRSTSLSPSSSFSPSPSATESPSPSSSVSASESRSSSLSPSATSSSSPSASQSLSPSSSESRSPSTSVSASISPSQEPGSGNYSYEALSILPITNAELAIPYGAEDDIAVSEDDSSYTSLTSSETFLVHEFKKTNNTNKDSIKITVNLKSTLAPTTQPIYLQVWNQSTTSWETIATKSTGSANTDFSLDYSISANQSNYYDTDYIVTFRVYQATGGSLPTLSIDYVKICFIIVYSDKFSSVGNVYADKYTTQGTTYTDKYERKVC